MPRHPLFELIVFRIKALYREPSALFWVFVFPLLTSVALGIAFRNRDLAELQVAVADGPDAEQIAKALDEVKGIATERVPLAEAKEHLRRGRVALVLVPGDSPEVFIDPTQPDGRTAKLMVLDGLERLRGRQDVVHATESTITAPGSRYIDFLIPGLLGFGLMSSGIWGVGWALVQMRTGKLLKRLVGTPMRRSHLFLSFMLSRLLMTVIEIAFFIAYARLLFDVRVFGSVPALFFFGLLGSVSFGGLAILVASRARNSETASGLMNLATMPMLVLSGVFFSATNFPAWLQPAIKLLPLTALNDGLRALMIDGTSIFALIPQIAVLAGWGLVSFVIALRVFRWN